MPPNAAPSWPARSPSCWSCTSGSRLLAHMIGIAGLGPRGRVIGARLRATGFRVLGFDDDVRAAAESGMRTVGSAERLAKECDVELVTLDGDDAARLVEELLAFGGITALTTIAL